MLRFSRNDPNQRYYLNGMWTCGPPVMIVIFLSSNENVAQSCSNCSYIRLFMAISTAIADLAEAGTDSEDSTDSLGYL